MVLVTRRDERSVNDLDLWLYKAGSTLCRSTPNWVDIATQAWLVFGKGRNPAASNFADCLSYALARRAGLPCSIRE